MPTAAEDFTANGMDYVKAIELARQMVGLPNPEWLVNIGFPSPLALELARQMTTGIWNADYLIALGVPPPLATAISTFGSSESGGGIAGTRYIAPVARGLADGSTAENATTFTNLNTLIGELSASGGEIIWIADEGNYGTPVNAIAITNGASSPARPITIRGGTAAGGVLKANVRGTRNGGVGGPPIQRGSPNGIWRLRAGVSNLIFEEFDIRNIENGYWNIYESGVDNIIIRNIYARDFMRLIENEAELSTQTRGATATNILMEDIEAYNWERAVARFRYGSNGITFRRITGSAEFFDGNSFCTGITIQVTQNGDGTDNPYNVTFEDISLSDIRDNNGSGYWNGDTIDSDDSGVQTIEGLVLRRIAGKDNSDSLIDIKARGGYICEDCEGVNIKRTVRDWNDGRNGPVNIVRLTSINPTRPVDAPSTAGTVCHVFLATTNAGIILTDARIVNRAQTVAYDLPTLGAGTARAALGSTIFLGEGGRTGQTIHVEGWDRWNVDIDFDLAVRDGLGDTSGFSSITVNPPFPTVDFAVNWRAGFEFGFVPAATATSTVVADLAFANGHTGEFSFLSNPGSKFSIVGTTLVLTSALNYATNANHALSIRAVYGIVGDGNPADNTTWDCYGLGYLDRTVVAMVTGAEETETATFAAAGVSAGLPALPAANRALANQRIALLKSNSLFTKLDASPFALGAPSLAWSLRDFKGTHQGSALGTTPPTFSPTVGWTGTGTGYVEWTSFAFPSLPGGSNFTQNIASIVLRIKNQLLEPGITVISSGANVILVPLNTSSSGSGRINSASSSTINSVTTSIGTWSLHRRSSTSQIIRQNGGTKLTNSTASNAPNSTPLRLFTGSGLTTFSFLTVDSLDVGALTDAETTALATVWDQYTAMVQQVLG